MAITPTPIPRGPVTAPLNFSHPPAPGTQAVNYVEDPPAGEPKRNLAVNPQPVAIADIRGRESEFTLDHDGFLAIIPPRPDPDNPSSDDDDVDFDDEASITARYYPEVTRLLLRHVPGATRVVLFDHTIRRARPGSKRAPVLYAHVDQTAASALQRVRRHLPAGDAAAVLAAGTRYRIVNVWRTLSPQGPLEAHPLAYASSSTFRDEDAIPVEHRYPGGYTGQTAAVAHRGDQAWYYWSGMTPDERLLLECFDSESLKSGNSQVKGGRTPHSAFEDPRTRPDAEGRESIEVRALVFGP
ncbi:7alpha-cephem-methoxylase P8 chain [Apiospora kogelbergensis]|uniref:7alpha-cephem-methoxylase P8 chain n=1 Tax=Apiospora kogelbergensis TaxID=1337665 RepID=A0AAW0R6D3_9PEZI